MELTQSKQMEAERLVGVERRQVRCRVDFIQLVVYVATAQLVVGRNVEVDALDKVLEVFESRRRDGNRAASKPVAAAVKPSHAPFAGSPLYGMQYRQPAATGTYCLKMPKLVALRPGSAAIAANPPAVGVNTWAPLVPVSPTG